MAVMNKLPNNPDNHLSEALKLIDPTGSLKPGTDAYETIRCMVQGWIREHGPNRALCMARIGAKHLASWRKFL